MLPKRIRTKTVQFEWKFDPDINTHSYKKIPVGSEGKVNRVCISTFGVMFYLIRFDCGAKLKISPTVLEVLEYHA